MVDRSDLGRAATPRGCVITGLSAAVLALLSPVVLGARSWRAWRRGPDPRSAIESGTLTTSLGKELRRIDIVCDVPRAAEPEFHRRLTDAVIRVAETLRDPDDVYHLAYRFPWEETPVVRPIGPQLQELGERFSLIQSQGKMAGRTVAWLTLGHDRALAEVLDPDTCDPEAPGELDALWTHPDVRWSMATEWLRVGPSWKFRLILVVPSEETHRVTTLLASLA
jgi:hypothetical protein